jgi:carbamoyltransferase
LPHIDPWAYDVGCSIGALNYLLDKHNIKRYADWKQDDENPQDEPSLYTILEVVQLLAEGKVVGWYQGNGEVGPRALGNRSILYDPSREDAKEKVNKIKQREWWRPFGASVLENKASQFFDLPESRYMLFNSNVLYSGIPGVTHVDGTCRHQTVPDNDTPFQWLLTYFELETGLPVLLNTSLNVKGKPLCSTIEQAVQLFKNTELDALCVGDTLYKK